MFGMQLYAVEVRVVSGLTVWCWRDVIAANIDAPSLSVHLPPVYMKRAPAFSQDAQ